MTTTVGARPASSDATRDPSVLVVLVARDAARWLRQSLQSLATQTHPRLGVVAVDNASTDGTAVLLQQALGERRVIRLRHNVGLAGAIRSAMELPAVGATDYLLVMHDDTALAPDAVARMVEAAEGIRGVERVGIVGPKVVDWVDPRLLREVGRSTDRFGHPYTPLQDGELDQGQYDRVLEVLFVSSCAMLISREALKRAGAFDERFAGHHDDLDFCWRARLAGFRVLMTPLAVALHRGAGARGERPQEHRRRSSRYYAERAALASMLKDYGIPTLLWLMPVYTVLGLARLAYLAVSRRFEDAFDLIAAWAWNIVHLPGTLRRRVRAQSVRAVRDRSVRRFMAATFRVPRWFERAEEFLEEDLESIGVEPDAPLLRRRRAAHIALGHPVLLGSIIGATLLAAAVRHLLGPETIGGGALPVFPESADAFFHELLSGVRTTVLGGTQPASPAVAALGATSWLSFGSTAVATKVLLGALPAVAGVLAYRSFARQTSLPATAIVAAMAYVLSGAVLWSFSEGRIALLVGVAALPVVWERFDGAFGRRRPERAVRYGVGLGVALAIAVSFLPGVLLGVGLIALAHVVTARRPDRGLLLTVLGTATAAVLAFPVVRELVGAPGPSLASFVGSEDPWKVLRLVPGDGPTSWLASAFLPIAAVICFAAAERESRGRSWRAMSVAVAATALAWLSAAGYLPDALTNAPVYLITAAFAEAAVIAYGASGLVSGLARQAFGTRQLAAAGFAIILGVGLGAQAIQVTLAEWAVRPNGVPPAWTVVESSGRGEFRILWIGHARGDRFPAPGGDPIGIAEAGDASVRFSITDRMGANALDTGRPSSGPGYSYLRSVVAELVGGQTGHAGSLLGPLGVRFVVAGDDDVPDAVFDRLNAQADLDRLPAGGLTIYRNSAALPGAFVASDSAWTAPESADLLEIAELPAVGHVRRLPAPETFQPVNIDASGEAIVLDQFDSAWRARNDGEEIEPRAAFGWAMAADVEAGSLAFDYTRQWARTVEMAVLGFLWLVALWVTRRPVSA